MKRNTAAFLCAILLTACGSGMPGIDPQKPAHAQAVDLTASGSPAQVASSLVDWLAEATPADNAFARELTREIISVYDSTDNYASRHFAFALDSIKSTLSTDRLARVYIVAMRPAHLGRTLRFDAEEATSDLIEKIREAYADDSVALQSFNQALNP